LSRALRGDDAFECSVCRGMLRAGGEEVALLVARAPRLEARDGLCRRHLRDLLADVPASSRAATVAALLETAAAAVADGRELPGCVACSRQEDVARRPPIGALCLHHLRCVAGHLTWDALRSGATRLAGAMEGGRALPSALWGSEGLAGIGDGDDACSICAARAEARTRQFEWLSDAVRRFPAQATGAATALCGPHAWRFAAFSSGSGRILVDLAASEWTARLRSVLAGLEHRPPDHLAGRLAALPAVLTILADDQGRLHLAVIARATVATALRTPAAVVAHLTATLFRAAACPICAAEDRAALDVAASGDAVVCASDLRVVRSAHLDRRVGHALRRATVNRLGREAAAVRDRGAVEDASGLAAVRPIRS
jgi:hypothetical protein